MQLVHRWHFEWQGLFPLCWSPTAAISHGTKLVKAVSRVILKTAV